MSVWIDPLLNQHFGLDVCLFTASPPHAEAFYTAMRLTYQPTRAGLVLVLALVDVGLVVSFWLGGTFTATPHPFERRSNPSAVGSWADNPNSLSHYGNGNGYVSDRLLRLRWGGSFPGMDTELTKMGDQGDEDDDNDDYDDHYWRGSAESGEKSRIVEFQVKLRRPLGLYLAEDERGVLVSQVSDMSYTYRSQE